MIRRPPRSTLDRSSAASDVYKRQVAEVGVEEAQVEHRAVVDGQVLGVTVEAQRVGVVDHVVAVAAGGGGLAAGVVVVVVGAHHLLFGAAGGGGGACFFNNI